jgi:hypothetical protein
VLFENHALSFTNSIASKRACHELIAVLVLDEGTAWQTFNHLLFADMTNQPIHD